VIVLSSSARIAPKNIVDNLLIFGLGLMIDTDGLWNILNFGNILQGRSYASMKTKHAIVNKGRKRQLLKKPINLIPDGIGIINILLQLEGTLIPKAHKLINPPILMRTPQQKHILRILQLQGKQHQHRL
jgi:hypothetical protein